MRALVLPLGEEDSLLVSALVKLRVLEVNAVSAAAEGRVVTNGTDAQILLPLRALHHTAGGLRLLWVPSLLAHTHTHTLLDWK